MQKNRNPINDLHNNKLIKPKALKSGDVVAAVSPSWGGASVFRHRYEAGKAQFEKTFGVKVIEAPNALRPSAELAADPSMRAQDLMWAFENPDIAGIIAIIGGDDCVRLLPHLDLDVIRANPKIFMGYSDTTALHFACRKAGLSAIYGPTFMAGFGENGGLFDYMTQSVRKTLFSTNAIGEIEANKAGWTDDQSLSWAKPEDQVKKRPLKSSTPVRILQGKVAVRGPLLGGCVEVLEMIKGTSVWPTLPEWDGVILFLETSEEAPAPDYFIRCLRNYAATGVLDRISAIILGRPANVPQDKLHQYDDALFHVVHKEAGLIDLPLMTQMDFGHTDPMFLMPYGAMAEVDPLKNKFSILDSAVV